MSGTNYSRTNQLCRSCIYSGNSPGTCALLRRAVFKSCGKAFYVRFSSHKHLIYSGVLIRSLAHSQQQIEYVQQTLKKKVREQQRAPNEWSHYCAVCEVRDCRSSGIIQTL